MDGHGARPRLHPEWVEALGDVFDGPEMTALKEFLEGEVAAGKEVYPPPHRFFAALDRTPPSAVKVVIVGQDPYHGPGEANGLSFSVAQGIPIPPSLRNIRKELADDLGLCLPDHGDLGAWADSGVLMLNGILSVERKKPKSHAGRGWEVFTDRVISVVNGLPFPVAFIAWGATGKEKTASVDESKHLRLQSAHPSFYSANKGFFGSRPFSKVNAFLKAQGRQPVDWSLPG